MSHMLVFLFVIVISPSLAYDGTNRQEYKKDVYNVREFENLHQPFKRACICGLTSLKCCADKGMVAKVSSQNNVVILPNYKLLRFSQFFCVIKKVN